MAGLSPIYRFIAKFKRVKPTGLNLSNEYLPFLPLYLTLNSDLWADLRFKETRWKNENQPVGTTKFEEIVLESLKLLRINDKLSLVK